MSTKSALLLAVLLLGVPLESAWGQPRGRPAPAPVDDALQEGAEGSAGDHERVHQGDGIARQLGDWAARALNASQALHRRLRERLGDAGAWAVIAVPLLLALLLLRARHRTTRARPASAARGRSGRLPFSASGSRRQRKQPTVALSAAEQPLPTGPAPFVATGAQELLLRLDERGGASLHETLCALGMESGVLDTLRFSIAQCMDETTWSAAIADRGVGWLRRLRGRWIAEATAQRLAGWIAAHPLVAEYGYRVDSAAAETRDDGWQTKLLLTQPSGLAAPLDEGQQQLLQRAQAALEAICAATHNPHCIVSVARQTDLAALLPDANDTRHTVRLAALCHGIDAFDHVATLGLVEIDRVRELRNALAEHSRTVGGTVPGTGCAVHALFLMDGAGARRPEIGALLAAVSGAAFSSSAVTLRLSKQAGLMRPAPQREALEALGLRATQWLAEPGKGEAAVFEGNLRRMLGHETLAAAQRVRAVARPTSRKPLWSRGPHDSPETVLIELHDQMLTNLAAQATAAEQRAKAILARLAYSGRDGQSSDVANRRLGYALASLGTETVRNTSPEVLSLMREAMAALRG